MIIPFYFWMNTFKCDDYIYKVVSGANEFSR